MKTGWSIILPLLIVATPALAQDASGKAEKPVKQKMICRADKTTGSRIASSTCATEAEWKTFDDAQATKARNFQKNIDDQNRVVPSSQSNAGPSAPGLPQ